MLAWNLELEGGRVTFLIACGERKTRGIPLVKGILANVLTFILSPVLRQIFNKSIYVHTFVSILILYNTIQQDRINIIFIYCVHNIIFPIWINLAK